MSYHQQQQMMNYSREDSHRIFMNAVSASSHGWQKQPGLAESENGPTLPETVPDKPKRPLTAYNYFFQEERKRLLADLPSQKGKGKRGHGKVGFSELAHIVSKKWKALSPIQRLPYDELAAKEKMRYHYQKQEWMQIKAAIEAKEAETAKAMEEAQVDDLVSSIQRKRLRDLCIAPSERRTRRNRNSHCLLAPVCTMLYRLPCDWKVPTVVQGLFPRTSST